MCFLLICNSKNILYAQFLDTLVLQFDIGKDVLNTQHLNQLQSLKKYQSNEISFLIYGYADYLGQPAANKLLSTKRAKNVQAAINTLFNPQPTYLVCMGLGQVDIKGATLENGNPLYRTVHIIVRSKNISATLIATSNTAFSSPRKAIHKIDSASVSSSSSNDNAVTTSIQTQLNATPIKGSFVLENLHFLRHVAILTEDSYEVLYGLLSTLKDNPNISIRIEGHICCNHIEGSNPKSAAFKLSQMRAATVYHFLQNNGIDKARLSYLGYGTLKPIVLNDQNEEDAIKNRRVEVRIMSR